MVARRCLVFLIKCWGWVLCIYFRRERTYRCHFHRIRLLGLSSRSAFVDCILFSISVLILILIAVNCCCCCALRCWYSCILYLKRLAGGCSARYPGFCLLPAVLRTTSHEIQKPILRHYFGGPESCLELERQLERVGVAKIRDMTQTEYLSR